MASKASKRLWREAGLVRRYVVEVAKEWRAIARSAVVIALLWIAAHYGAALLAQALPHVPSEVAPWLTRNRLIVASVFLVLAVAQYRAWRKLRLNIDCDQAEIDPRFKRVAESSGPTPPDDPEVREFRKLVGTESLPPYCARVCVEAVKPIGVAAESAAFIAECDASVHKVGVLHYLVDGQKAAQVPTTTVHVRHNVVRIDFWPLTNFKVGGRIEFALYSHAPIHLKKLDVAD